MAATIGGAPSTRELRLTFTDEAGETAPVNLTLDGSISDADVQAIVDDYAASTSAFLSAEIVDKFSITGIVNTSKPAVGSLVARILAMSFTKANPLNDSKIVAKEVVVPSYNLNLRNDSARPIVPITSNAAYNALWALLENNLDLLMVNGTHYPGQWTYSTASKFGTKATVTDGL